MGLSAPLVAAVLFAALLHAGWNALIKSGGDKPLDTALIHSLGVLFAIPAALWFGLPGAAAWPFIAASSAIHVAYYIALAGAYRHGDLSLTYPIMRGSAPLLVALASAGFVGEPLSGTAWLGVLVISAGVLLVGLARMSTQAATGHRGKAIGFALANAAVIASYTVVDGMGVRAAGDPFAYAAAIFLIDGLPYAALVLWRRGPERGAALRYMRGRVPLALGGSAASLGSYAIALWAMAHAPVALVAALRETSVIFAALIGMLFLGERFGWARALGAALVAAGVVTLRFS
ncbi:EamA family transporter [Pseudorhodoferax sp.]|uniref:EamA family transporter n=1 Tax=Pseudorhodoferax sp. TaxID=1993553 RepID=UPI002DD658E2|nr:EamA family transporter [Pseudorhodoferax sp.]